MKNFLIRALGGVTAEEHDHNLNKQREGFRRTIDAKDQLIERLENALLTIANGQTDGANATVRRLCRIAKEAVSQ